MIPHDPRKSSSTDLLYRPKVKRKKKNDNDKGKDEIAWE